MKKALLSLALALVAAPSAFAQLSQLPVVPHGPFFIAEAYPVIPDTHDERVPCRGGAAGAEIAPNNRWIGEEQDPADSNSRAVGGVLALAETSNHRLNAAAFAVCEGSDAFVQSFRLIKRIPGSQKCPNTFKPDTFFQFGSTQVRTWWTLIYTQPGTTFTLELTVRCLDTLGRPMLHIDRYTWEVVATIESLLNVIDVLHTGALGTTEIPCISSETVYAALVQAVTALRTAVASGPRQAQQDALFQAEATLLSFCSFTDCFIPEDVFSSQYPPGNDMQFGDFGFTGVVDTIENPCCCKILVDLEFIGTCYGIVSL